MRGAGALAEGDIVLSVDNKSVSGEDLGHIKTMLVGKRASMVAIKVQRAKHILTVNLKRGSWGPDHCLVSTEHPQEKPGEAKIQPQRASVAANHQEPLPSQLEAPASVLPHDSSVAPAATDLPKPAAPRRAWQNDEGEGAEGPTQEAHADTSLSGVLVQGSYAAARRSQGYGPLASSHEASS